MDIGSIDEGVEPSGLVEVTPNEQHCPKMDRQESREPKRSLQTQDHPAEANTGGIVDSSTDMNGR